MSKKYAIFSIENNDTVINYAVDKAMYKAYQILSNFSHHCKESTSGFNKITIIRTN
jgi:hypothetical protein